MNDRGFLLSIIIVNWNGGQVLLDCLESVFACAHPFPFEVIVVDNASTDGSPEQVAERFPQVRLVRNSKNVGFAGGNNRGLEMAQGRYWLLLNSDTRVPDDALEILLEEMDSHPETGVMGCCLIFPDGHLQRSFGEFPNLLTEILDQTMLHRLVTACKMRGGAYDRAHEVDWVTGACMLVRKEVFAQIGGLDEGYHMFLEDVDWCLRARQAGWRVRYTPRARVVHIKGFSSQSVMPQMIVEDQYSAFRFFRKHHGPSRVLALRAIVSLGCLVRGFRWTVLALRRKEGASGRLNAYREVLRRTWTDRAYNHGGIENGSRG
jgi:GT2 family glycosyltransferase